MIKVNPVKELNQKREATINDAEAVVKEVKLLMEADDAADKDALRRAGLDFHLNQVENKKGETLEREKFEEEYKNKVFTESEIKAICIKYDLRFLNTEHFIGKIDGRVANELSKFMKEHCPGNERGSFFIMGPGASFKLDAKKREPRPVDDDPVLFYKLRNNTIGNHHEAETKYVYIHKWGKDFTIARRLRAIFFKNVFSMWFYTLMAWSMLGFGLNYMMGGSYWHMAWIIPAAFVPAMFTLAIMFGEFERWDKRTSKYLWNERMTRRAE